MSRKIWIKICGVRDPETALACVDAGADAIGLNFYPQSKRFLADRAVAADIVAAIGSRALAVGLFVNESPTVIARCCDVLNLHAIQLHGDESPADLERIRSAVPRIGIVFARRVSAVDMPELSLQLRECSERNVPLTACLLDAKVEGAYGGTGEKLPWQQIAAQIDRQNWPPIILAGGLTPRNVTEAIRIVRPWGVDVAGGVESAPGVKDLAIVRDFIQAVHAVDATATGGAT